jgi:dTDP-4-amino-4,6-dideoxygalactose transaminase
MTSEDKKAVFQALNSRWLTGGPLVRSFESDFAHYVGSKFAVAVNSCTAALHISMRALDIGVGDEVIVPDLTFAATANAAIFCGAKPVLADIDERTFNLSPEQVRNKITSKTKAIIPVHYGGQSCDMKELLEIAHDYHLHVVEDCAHSLGADYKNKKTGTFGAMGCFSFYPTKIITTLEGGMVTTDDEKLDKKLRLLREHGMSRNALERESGATWHYDVVDLGYNYRMTDPQAALGASQLKRIEDGIKRRIRIADYYDEKLTSPNLGLVIPFRAPNRSHIFHLYTLKIPESQGGLARNELFKRLAVAGIQSSVHYTPLHLMSFYKQFLNKKSDKFPIAEKIYHQIISLPLYPTLTKKEVLQVTHEITDFINKTKFSD